MTLDDALGDAGFELVQSTKDGTRRFSLRPNDYLQWWVYIHADDTAEFTWEVELGAYLKSAGFAISVQDELSLMLFPATEVRGPADVDWVVGQIEAAKAHLGSVDLIQGI